MKILNNALLYLLVILFLSVGVFGQTAPADQTTADDNFRLSIIDKSVTETDYHARMQLSLKSATRPAFTVKAGAGVEARMITLTLKNVFGDVQFRGSLEKILDQFDLHRPPNKDR